MKNETFSQNHKLFPIFPKFLEKLAYSQKILFLIKSDFIIVIFFLLILSAFSKLITFNLSFENLKWILNME